MPTDYELKAHREWIGSLEPVGLVVSPPALAAAQAFVNRDILREQQALAALMTFPAPKKRGDTPSPLLPSFPLLAEKVLGWKPGKVLGAPLGEPVPDSLSVHLQAFGETLRPTYAVRSLPGDEGAWMMLIQELPPGAPLDTPPSDEGRGWHASAHARFERLLDETKVPIGVLTNGHAIRLVYAPPLESSGHVTWPAEALLKVAHRDLLSALVMLLGAPRLFTLPREQRLPSILKESRKYQSVVSNALAGQVLEALNELLRGFQAADEASATGRPNERSLLQTVLAEDPDHVYAGLLSVLLRLVFVLYAEERGLMSASSVYVRHYSVTGLFEKLRADHGRFPDTMDQRYGAWARLLVLFRMVHDGAKRGDFMLPARYGHLFDPSGWAFLEGREHRAERVEGALVKVPKVPDGVVYRVLDKLLMLGGDRLSYRALDVEQIGSVYENMMGFRLERAGETSIGVGKDHVIVGLEGLLAKKGAAREAALKELADLTLSGKTAEAFKAAASVDGLVAALGKRISPLTPRPIPKGGLYLQPTDERRRSGSHYTPRELTRPIVETALAPVLAALGPSPTPEAILALKVCDPAMGSAAFLVETCRRLGKALAMAYAAHGVPDKAPLDETLELFAQREVAQHCLYGVDKNPLAVDLGKLSLWLATLAKGHPFTFVDHAIRHGDSLVGLTPDQIKRFHWDAGPQMHFLEQLTTKALGEARDLRTKIQDLSSSDNVTEKQDLLIAAEDALERVRLAADCLVGAFFASDKPKAREAERKKWQDEVERWLAGEKGAGEIEKHVDELRGGDKPLPCFHWALEFPEVFAREGDGFDVMVGNPPFAGKNTLINGNRAGFVDWLKELHEESHGNADLVAHFYRRAFSLLRARGTFGLIATNTIAQGDTRSTGLRWICTHGGDIFAAQRRVAWPGLAAVVVSVVHVMRGSFGGERRLDGRAVPQITAFLFHDGGHDTPVQLRANANKAFIGSYILGMGFTFDDTNEEATPIAEMHRLIAKNPRNGGRIFPYIGGEEVNTSPTHSHHRYVINFGEMSEEEARAGWPELMAIVEKRVKPARLAQNREIRARYWWRFGETTPALNAAIRGLDRVLVISRVGQYGLFAFLPSGMVFSEGIVVFVATSFSMLAILQSRVHEIWARFFASSMKDDLRYTPSDCFETFPFPPGWESLPALEAAGQAYYDFRAALMIKNNEGLTKTYNRFHDPNEHDPDVVELRDLHAAMDRAVLDAYGWTDVAPTCEFLLDYEEDDSDPLEAPLPRRKKKPWRYRWPDDVRDTVLAKLLALNAEQARSEAAPPPAPNKATPEKSAPKKPKAQASKKQIKMFGEGE